MPSRPIMTIHSDWSRILHEECPSAFVKGIPRGDHRVGIIDGHLQLMRLHSGIPTWDAFAEYLFVRPIMRLFEAGCATVVLCFDSYDNVPAYKSMTQNMRVAKHSEVKVFLPHQELPSCIPPDAMLFLMNRHFKLKVIDLLCSKVPGGVGLKPGQRLVLDYRKVVVYEHGCCVPAPLDPTLVPMGESDVKFCRYVHRFGNALVHAIDGDYLVIALLYYARYGMNPNNKMFIYRHLSTLSKKGDDGAGEGTKRKRQKTEAESKCWVDMQLLFAVIARSVWMSMGTPPLNPTTRAVFTDADAVVSAVFLMLSAGTDFSRGLPLVGPKRMWDALPSIAMPLLLAVRGAPEVDEDLFTQNVVGKLYKAVYERQLKKAPRSDLASVLGALSTSALAPSTKGRLPTEERVTTTLRNVKWVVKYWETINGVPETPLDGTYGFSMGSDGVVCFHDMLSE